jgi:hypothetical protein
LDIESKGLLYCLGKWSYICREPPNSQLQPMGRASGGLVG